MSCCANYWFNWKRKVVTDPVKAAKIYLSLLVNTFKIKLIFTRVQMWTKSGEVKTKKLLK